MSAVERVATRAVRRWRARVVAAAREAVPGAVVRETSAGVTIEGRGLVRRLLTDARLRWVAGWLR